MRSKPVPRGVRLYDPATLARLCRARDYLADRFNRRTSLEEAARQAYLSPFYFGRLFAEAFGETPHEFVTRLRIERAKRQLLADRGSVTDICFDVGYESLGSFSTRFRTLTGLSPAAFRREARRVFGFRRWRLFYIPACYQYFSMGLERSLAPLGMTSGEIALGMTSGEIALGMTSGEIALGMTGRAERPQDPRSAAAPLPLVSLPKGDQP